MVHLDLRPLTVQDVPDPSTDPFQAFLDDHFKMGIKLAESMNSWPHHSVKVNGTVQIVNLTTASSLSTIRNELGVKEYWCGRISKHTAESVDAMVDQGSKGPLEMAKGLRRRLSHKEDHKDEAGRQAAMMQAEPQGLYERFRRGLLEYHSEHEREYIEACRETECLQVFQPHVAEVWRLTLASLPRARDNKRDEKVYECHDKCPEKQGAEKSRVRGKYVSVEMVSEASDGSVEWRMATSSDAGGNIPRFMTNSSLPKSIAEDVPSFLKYIAGKFPANPGVQT